MRFLLDLLQKYEEYYAYCESIDYNENFMILHSRIPIKAGTP